MEQDTFEPHPNATLPVRQSGTMGSPAPMFAAHHTKRLRSIAAGMCFLSELIHLWLLPEQYEIFIGYGIIFLLITMVQGFIGVHLLFEPRRRLLTSGLWVNAFIVVLYGFTHTIGVPVGLAFLPLPIDVWGVMTVMISLLVVVLLWFLRHDMPRLRRAHGKKRPGKFIN
ncbi:hypothetical protein [Dictyobacter kobayashii]|uniref:Uncharacterized protein n=1 Tax=Dictyobacter kobayashii TaxID=2014872 RepID=A0A402AV56_9CHLR|nr:hypothetical protein [Dictyobacter kobayashii]GCE23020.1 hypothetical protein KDK_68200 [Dictyobacter kobayashii]